jgi:hypothetical protein
MPRYFVVGLRFESRRVHRIRPSGRRIISVVAHKAAPSAKPGSLSSLS